MSYWKVFIKLMSKHWPSHLGVPLIVGSLVETLNTWAASHDPSFSVGGYLVSREGLISHIGILSLIITFLCVAVWYVHKDAKPPWTNTTAEQLAEVLQGAKSFFATCTIPLEQWFHPDTQQYFCLLLKERLLSGFPQHRVLLFKSQRDLAAANEQYLDAPYSKSLADIHWNYSIPLGYLAPDEIAAILKDFRLVDRAEIWKDLQIIHDTDPMAEANKPTLSTLDFGLVGYGNNEYQAYTFNKSGETLTLDVITDTDPYVKLRNEIRARVFDERGLANAKHDFAVYCGMTRLEIEQPFVD